MQVKQVDIKKLKFSEYNPRTITKRQFEALKRSIKEFGIVEPVVVSKDYQVIGGHMRIRACQDLKIGKIGAVIVTLDKNRQKLLNLALNKISGDWDEQKLAELVYGLNTIPDIDLALSGFDSKEISNLLSDVMMDIPETFDLAKELKKIKITKFKVKKGDIYQLGNNRLMCGSCTDEKTMVKLMDGKKAALCLTDPPYQLAYLQKNYKGKAPTQGFGYKTNRQYMETDKAPSFEDWVPLVNRFTKPDANIMIYENWKNIRSLWDEMEKYWEIKNMIIWHLTNRVQGFAAKRKFFSKYDIALLGSKKSKIEFNLKEEGEFQNEYEIALYAIKGKPYWESYRKGKKVQPTDFIEFQASNEKHSGQSVIFGTKPVEILIPYVKVLTEQGDIVLEPFCGSGSMMITCEKLNRICYAAELVPIYCEVIIRRWERLTGKKARRLN